MLVVCTCHVPPVSNNDSVLLSTLQGIVGNLSSGKSALVHRYLTGTYVQEESPEGKNLLVIINVSDAPRKITMIQINAACLFLLSWPKIIPLIGLPNCHIKYVTAEEQKPFICDVSASQIKMWFQKLWMNEITQEPAGW